MSNPTKDDLVYSKAGYCPICRDGTEFVSRFDWYRDHLFCTRCKSIPRERALALVLDRQYPQWRDLGIHESSPGSRGISVVLRKECSRYVATHYFPGEATGTIVRGFRNENLERQTFPDASFDLVVSLDVMEHVNDPEASFAEVARTLRDEGAYIFTAPTYKGKIASERRARYLPNGEAEHFAEPEYHGNPISEKGALVTFHYGYDLAELIHKWSGLNVEVARFHDHHHGIIGDFTEVYVASKVTGSESARRMGTQNDY